MKTNGTTNGTANLSSNGKKIKKAALAYSGGLDTSCLLYTSPSPRD